MAWIQFDIDEEKHLSVWYHNGACMTYPNFLLFFQQYSLQKTVGSAYLQRIMVRVNLQSITWMLIVDGKNCRGLLKGNITNEYLPDCKESWDGWVGFYDYSYWSCYYRVISSRVKIWGGQGTIHVDTGIQYGKISRRFIRLTIMHPPKAFTCTQQNYYFSYSEVAFSTFAVPPNLTS